MNKIITGATVSMIRPGDMVLLDMVTDDAGNVLLPFANVEVATIEHARSSGMTLIRDANGTPIMASPGRSCTISRSPSALYR